MRRAKIDPSEHSQIVEAYRLGVSQPRIALSYGVSHTTIGNILREAGEETRVGGGQYYQSELDESNTRILSFLDEGWTLSAIAAHEGIALPSLDDRLRVLGKERVSTERARHPDRQALYEKIRIAWGFGMEVSKIRDSLHISSDTIYKAIGPARRGKGYWAAKKGKVRASQYKGLYDTGMTLEEVAELTGSHPHSVRRLIKKYFPDGIREAKKTRTLKKRRLQKAANKELMKADHVLSLLGSRGGD